MRETRKNQYSKHIRRIALHVMKLQDDMLAPYNITSQQARVVGLIDRGCCHQKDLEAALGLRGSSVTSLLQGLEKRGYIRRTSAAEDARSKLLTLTDKGLELLETFMKIFHCTEKKIVEGLSQGERALLLELLERVSGNLDKGESC